MKSGIKKIFLAWWKQQYLTPIWCLTNVINEWVNVGKRFMEVKKHVQAPSLQYQEHVRRSAITWAIQSRSWVRRTFWVLTITAFFNSSTGWNQATSFSHLQLNIEACEITNISRMQFTLQWLLTVGISKGINLGLFWGESQIELPSCFVLFEPYCHIWHHHTYHHSHY